MSQALLDAIKDLSSSAVQVPALSSQISQIRRMVSREVEAKADLEAQVSRYQTVLSRALDVAATNGLGPIAEKVIDGMLEVAGANRGFVGLADPMGGWEVLVARNMAKDDIPDPKSQISTSIIGKVLRTGEPIVTEDARSEEELRQARSVFQLRLRSVACLPLIWDGQTVGFVYLDDARSRGIFDEAALTAVRAWLPLAAESVSRARVSDVAGPLGFPTRSGPLLADLERIARITHFNVSILLTGETGTGKSMLASKVHTASPRAARPFVHVNCGAIPEALLEAELFGAEAGAYTSAKASRQGRFEAAEGGTLFLDELDTMPIACQVKLLVALQERTITRLGSNNPIPVDVRILAAMSSEPARAIAEGKLREDLYYRLAVVEIRLPALRERREDLPLIVRSLLEKTQTRYGLPPLRLSETALAQLYAHHWPGNVRELQNAIDRAALFSNNGEITEIRYTQPSLPASAEPHDESLMGVMRAAARRYIDTLRTNPKLQGLDLVDGFRGLVVQEAIQRFGGRDEAFVALGEGALVTNRNHHRVIRRELDRLVALEAAAEK